MEVEGRASSLPINIKRDHDQDQSSPQKESLNKRARLLGDATAGLALANVRSSTPLLKLLNILLSQIPHTSQEPTTSVSKEYFAYL